MHQQQRTILLIEDNDKLRRSFRYILEQDGFRVISAANGKEGVQCAVSNRPDVILCDVMMPEMDGYDVLKEVRRVTALAATQFVFITAKAEIDDVRYGMNLGADDYLTKPLEIKELRRTVQTRIQRRDQQFRQALEKVAQFQDNIAAMLPHELRTPVSGILGAASMVTQMTDSLSKDEMREFHECIQLSAERMSRMIENCLLYIHLKTQRSNMELLNLRLDAVQGMMVSHAISRDIAFDAHDVIREVAELCTDEQNRSDDLRVVLEPANVSISERYLRKVMQELCSNALKFSESATPITIQGFVEKNSEGDTYHLAISNVGRGMSKEQIESVAAFMQFERDVYEQQGIGLGLAIVWHIVELSSGRVQIACDPGGNFTAHLYLPLAAETVMAELGE
jgi:two-component system, sensor histidine kinase and response regulator